METARIIRCCVCLVTVFVFAVACNSGKSSGTTAQQSTKTPTGSSAPMKIRIKLGDKIATATLEESETTRDFVSLLPLKLSMRDYASTEKIADLPRKLNTAGAPEGVDPSIGDVAYYAPWGNIAIYYKDFDYSKGLVKLGRIDSGLDYISKAGTSDVTIELAQ